MSRAVESARTAAGADLVEKPMPIYRLPYLDERSGSLLAFRGRVIFANGATWCTPCHQEMPRLERLSRAYAKQGVIVVGIDVGEAPGGCPPLLSPLT